MTHVIRLGTVSTTGKEAFKATLYDGQKYIAQKQAEISQHGEQLAYEIVDLWAKEKAAEYDCEYAKKPISVLRGTISTTKKKTANKKGYRTWRHQCQTSDDFKSLIEVIYEMQGWEKTRRWLDLGFKHYQAHHEFVRTEQERQKKANWLVANSLIKAEKETGVDMRSSINNPDVLRIYNEIKDGLQKAKAPTEPEQEQENILELPSIDAPKAEEIAEKYKVPRDYLMLFYTMVNTSCRWTHALEELGVDKRRYPRGVDMTMLHRDFCKTHNKGNGKVHHQLSLQGQALYEDIKEAINA